VLREGERETVRQGKEAAGARRRRIEESSIGSRPNRCCPFFWHPDNFQKPGNVVVNIIKGLMHSLNTLYLKRSKVLSNILENI